MNTIGIIAEYNPLHAGHIYQLNAAHKDYGADAVVVVMSGDFVQRGEPAVTDKYERAELAVKNGADLVIMLPVISSLGGAGTFTRAGVSLLEHLGIIDTLLFGAESDDTAAFDMASDILCDEPSEYKAALTSSLKSGLSFAAARENAIRACMKSAYPAALTLDLSAPNTTLGLEYIAALKKRGSHIKPVILKRRDDLKCASLIRNEYEALPLSGQIKNEYLFSDDLSLALHTALLNDNDYAGYMDCDKALSSRIKTHLNDFVSTGSFTEIIKSKNHSYTHISRVLMHILLHLTKDLEALSKSLDDAPYIRVIASNKTGEALMSEISRISDLPLITNIKSAEKLLSPDAYRLFLSDIHASDMRRAALTSKTKKIYASDYSRRFTVFSDGTA